MKFITEDDLRMSYREAPFTEYPYQEHSRLTPGGRQFLLDRGIRIQEREQPGTMQPPEPAADIASDRTDTAVKARLALATASAVFLQIGLELLELDVLTAQEVFSLEQYLTGLLLDEEGAGRPDLPPCTGLSPDNFDEPAGSCFAINGFHARTEKGREIVRLHYLRCLLQEQEPWLAGGCKKGVNCVINRLSQMICQALGGTICQRKQ